MSKTEMDFRTEQNNLALSKDQNDHARETIEKLNIEITNYQKQIRQMGADNEKLHNDLYNKLQEKDSEIERLKSGVRMLEREVEVLKSTITQTKEQYDIISREKN